MNMAQFFSIQTAIVVMTVALEITAIMLLIRGLFLYLGMKAHQTEGERQRLDKLTRAMSTVEMRYPHLIAMNVEIENNDLMQCGAKQIAIQLALLDSLVFKKIKEKECLEQRWKKRDKGVHAPGILQMIAQFNDVSKWVQLTIVNTDTPHGRKRCIQKFVEMASYLRDIGDFSSLCAIYNGLSSSNVYQLRTSWRLLSKTTQREFEKIKALFGWKMTTFKKLQNDLEPPCVPHIGLLLDVLVKIDQSIRIRNENVSVNHLKKMKMRKQIKRLTLWQEKCFDHEHDVKLQMLLIHAFRCVAVVPDDVLYRQAKALAVAEKH